MNEAILQRPYKGNTILFRAFCLYLIFYFLFISDFASNYRVLWHINTPLKYLSDALGIFLYKSFFKPEFKEIRFFDSYWTYSKLLFFLLFALIIAAIWTFLDKGKGSRRLFICMHALSRYYLFVALFLYGIWKIFENQFMLSPHEFLRPIDYYNPQILLWTSIAASRSYQIFGGIMEVLAGLLLLSRRTTTIGALLSLSLMMNVLILDFGYDIPVKIIAIHLLLFNLLILWPDILSLFRFFIMGGAEKLSAIPSVIGNKRWQGLVNALKALIIVIAIIPQVIYLIRDPYHMDHPIYKEMVGIYEMDTSYQIKAGISPHIINPKSWKKFTIEKRNALFVLDPGDSITKYNIDADTLKKTIKITSWDNAIQGNLHYMPLDSAYWLFEGHIGQDSLRLITRQIDIFKHPMLKDFGKIKWSWKPWEPPTFNIH